MTVKFIAVKDKDLVCLGDFYLCTIDYDGDFGVQQVRADFRKMITDHFKEKEKSNRRS